MELADTSAWTASRKDASIRASFDQLLRAGSIVTCDAVKLELLVETRDESDFSARRAELEYLRRCPISERVWRRALDVMQALAERGPLHHRQVPILDLLVAATGELAELPVVHYDRDFELIAEVTGQPVRPIAPLGSL
jgi:predicted nucleic acid-binding protein